MNLIPIDDDHLEVLQECKNIRCLKNQPIYDTPTSDVKSKRKRGKVIVTLSGTNRYLLHPVIVLTPFVVETIKMVRFILVQGILVVRITP